jgi:hypothetical protein
MLTLVYIIMLISDKFKKEINKKIKFSLLLTFLTLPLYADVPIGGALVMTLPMVSLYPSWGSSLVAVILIEMLVIKRKLDLKYLEALKLSLYANLFSTLIGAGIPLAYSSSFAFLIFWIPGSFLLFRWFTYLSTKTGFLKNSSKNKALRLLPFLAIGIIGFFFGYILTPVTVRLDEIIFPLFLQLISLIILLTTGFLITFITEGYIIARCYSQKPDKIISTVLLMNLISYIALIPVLSIGLNLFLF